MGETTDPSAGLVQVAPNSFGSNQCMSGDCLRLGGYSSGNFGAERSVDLAGATTATLSYTWGVDTGEGYYAEGVQPKVQVWNDGGATWVTLHSLPEGQEGPTDQAAAWDISAYADANTKIRFITDATADIQGFVFFDNIQIETDAVPPLSNVIVNSTGDLGDNNIGDDVCDTGGTIGVDPECTLRAAIQEANASAAVDTIEFDIPGSDPNHSLGVWTITPGSGFDPLSTRSPSTGRRRRDTRPTPTPLRPP